MPSRFATRLTLLVIADAVVWVVAVHATVTYHAVRDGPTVMSLGDLLGWFIAVGLLVIVVLMVVSRVLRRRHASTMSTRR